MKMGRLVTMEAAVMLAWSTSVAYAGQDDDFLFKQQMYDDKERGGGAGRVYGGGGDTSAKYYQNSQNHRKKFIFRWFGRQTWPLCEWYPV